MLSNLVYRNFRSFLCKERLNLYPFRISLIRPHCFSLHPGHDLRRCAELRTKEPLSLHIYLLARRFSVRYVYQRLRSCPEAHVWWKQPIHTPQHLRLRYHYCCVYHGSNELFQ